MVAKRKKGETGFFAMSTTETRLKATIYRIANQRGISMSALLREWIDEHLDLPLIA